MTWNFSVRASSISGFWPSQPDRRQTAFSSGGQAGCEHIASKTSPPARSRIRNGSTLPRCSAQATLFYDTQDITWRIGTYHNANWNSAVTNGRPTVSRWYFFTSVGSTPAHPRFCRSTKPASSLRAVPRSLGYCNCTQTNCVVLATTRPYASGSPHCGSRMVSKSMIFVAPFIGRRALTESISVTLCRTAQTVCSNG